MTHHATRAAVDREYRALAIFLRWLHPEIAAAICKRGYDDAQRRIRQRRTDMLIRGMNDGG